MFCRSDAFIRDRPRSQKCAEVRWRAYRLSGIADALSCGCMIGMTDHQLQIITTAANGVPVERRGIFLERVGAMLKVRWRFSDDDVRQVAALAAW